MNSYSVLALLSLVLILSQYLGNFKIVDLGYLIVGAFSLYVNRYHINITGLINIVLIVRTFEYFIWWFWDTSNAYHVYPVQILLDIFVVFLISKRWEIYLHLNPNTQPNEIVFTHADYYLKQLYKLHIVIISAALFEHILRHTYHIGLPSHWAIPEALFIYNNIIVIKFALNIFEFVLILAMAHTAMRKAKF